MNVFLFATPCATGDVCEVMPDKAARTRLGERSR